MQEATAQLDEFVPILQPSGRTCRTCRRSFTTEADPVSPVTEENWYTAG